MVYNWEWYLYVVGAERMATHRFNSLAPRGCGTDFKCAVFKCVDYFHEQFHCFIVLLLLGE